jgi:hypothetical protein
MRISKHVFVATLALFTLQSTGCIVSINDGDTGNDDTTADDSGGDGDSTTGTESGSSESEGGDGDSGTTGDTDGGTSGDGDAGGDGDGDCAAYGDPSETMNMCCEGETALSIMGIDGAFCSPGCTSNADCPASGDLDVQCVLGPTDGAAENCAVICMVGGDNSDCPSGSTCKDIMQGGNVGICTYP